jgi:hypothetical protein
MLALVIAAVEDSESAGPPGNGVALEFELARRILLKMRNSDNKVSPWRIVPDEVGIEVVAAISLSPHIQALLGRFGSEVGSVLEAVRPNAFSAHTFPPTPS